MGWIHQQVRSWAETFDLAGERQPIGSLKTTFAATSVTSPILHSISLSWHSRCVLLSIHLTYRGNVRATASSSILNAEED